MPRNKKGRKYITTDEWSWMRAKWVAGECTLAELAERFGVTEGYLKKKSHQEKWRAQKPELKRRRYSAMIDEFAKAGLPREELFRLIAEGAKNTQMLRNLKIPQKRKEMVNGKEVEREIVTDRAVPVVDNETTYKYRNMVIQMLGDYAPPKQPVVVPRDHYTEEEESEEERVRIVLPDNKRDPHLKK